MKILILFLFNLVFSVQIFAQVLTFEQIGGTAPAPTNIVCFDGVAASSIAFADVDNDNDQDVLIVGNNSNQYIAKLYSNNGMGSYTEVIGTPFTGVVSGSIAFADVDNDMDLDVLITGRTRSNLFIANLYSNNGSGSYTLVSGTPFEGVANSSIAFADVDNDTDLDVLITGENSSNQGIANLYTNNGSGSYTLVTGTPFNGVEHSSIAFADVDNDMDLDVLITGFDDYLGRLVSKLYSNNGSGGYTEVIGTPFEGVQFGSTAFADVDNDTDQDILITGHNKHDQYISKLYRNNGSGIYSRVLSTPFTGVRFSSIAFSDVDNDMDLDLLITGREISGQVSAKLYSNNGTGSYTEVSGTPFNGVDFSSIAFADVDMDNDQDVLITGSTNNDLFIAELYSNIGTGSYMHVPGTPFHGVNVGSIALADVDLDNDLDVLITGEDNSNQAITKLYNNNGSGGYTEVIGTPFDGVYNSSIAFADIDNDNDLDVLITGEDNSNQEIAKLYTNNSNGNYTEVTGTPFEGVRFSSIAFADIDNDNDLDVLITGKNSSNQEIAKLYTNNSTGSFTEATGTPFDGVSFSSIAFADVDNDNDLDVLITGENISNQVISKLYTNNGTGSFTEVIGTPFDGVYQSSIAFADVDNDTDLDILITGINSSNQEIAKLYTNNSTGGYTEVSGTTFDGVYNSSIAFADLDNDNDQDVLITGKNNSNQAIAKLYTNNGSGSYTLFTGTPFAGVSFSSIAIADVDNDNDQDVLITGKNNSDQNISKIYRNLFSFPCQNVIDTSIRKQLNVLYANEKNATYQWFDCTNQVQLPNESSDSLIVPENGTYAVIISKNNCIDTSSCIRVTGIGINKNSSFTKLRVFPNPTIEIVTLDFSQTQGSFSLQVRDITGRLIDSKSSLASQLIKYHINGPKGIYFFTISDQFNNRKFFKIIKQ